MPRGHWAVMILCNGHGALELLPWATTFPWWCKDGAGHILNHILVYDCHLGGGAHSHVAHVHTPSTHMS